MAPVEKKRLVLVGAVVGASALMWFVSDRWLAMPERFSDWHTWIVPFMVLTAQTAVVCLAFAMLDRWYERVAAITASWALFVVFFPPGIWYISAFPVFLWLWADGARKIRAEVGGQRTLRMRTAMSAGVHAVLLGTFLMISLGFYLLPAKVNLSSVSKGIQSSVNAAYDSPLVQAQFADLPPELQSQFKQEVGRQVDAYVRQWLGPVRDYLPPLLALVLFLSLWGLTGLLRHPAMWLASGLFVALKKTGFIRVTEESVKAEVVSL